MFLNQRKKAVDAELKSDMRNVAMAVETLVSDRLDLYDNVMLLGGARFENGWNSTPGRIDWIQWGSPTLEENLGVSIDADTYLYGKWTRVRGVHAGGLCMVAASKGGTYRRIESAVQLLERPLRQRRPVLLGQPGWRVLQDHQPPLRCSVPRRLLSVIPRARSVHA